MSTRNIEKIIKPNSFNWVGDAFYTTSFVGSTSEITRERMDPFIGIGYNPTLNFTGTLNPRGVGAHPHKGFETVTIAYQGKIAHKDSKGNYGVIGEGDVQWMTAGSGILHQEYHEKEWSKKGGPFQMVQLWVNLPAKYKLTTPHYQDLLRKNITKVVLENNNGTIDVIAGKYKDSIGKATTYSPLHLYNIRLNKDGISSFDFPNHYNTGLIVIKGSIRVNHSEIIPQDHFALLENNKETFFEIQATTEDTIVLLLSGEPLNEPIVMYGPFVMNNEEQIKEAFSEFKNGKYGTI